MAKHLLKRIEKNNNYGVNSLYYQVLWESSADNLPVKFKTSLAKNHKKFPYDTYVCCFINPMLIL